MITHPAAFSSGRVPDGHDHLFTQGSECRLQQWQFGRMVGVEYSTRFRFHLAQSAGQFGFADSGCIERINNSQFQCIRSFYGYFYAIGISFIRGFRKFIAVRDITAKGKPESLGSIRYGFQHIGAMRNGFRHIRKGNEESPIGVSLYIGSKNILHLAFLLLCSCFDRSLINSHEARRGGLFNPQLLLDKPHVIRCQFAGLDRCRLCSVLDAIVRAFSTVFNYLEFQTVYLGQFPKLPKQGFTLQFLTSFLGCKIAHFCATVNGRTNIFVRFFEVRE